MDEINKDGWKHRYDKLIFENMEQDAELDKIRDSRGKLFVKHKELQMKCADLEAENRKLKANLIGMQVSMTIISDHDKPFRRVFGEIIEIQNNILLAEGEFNE